MLDSQEVTSMVFGSTLMWLLADSRLGHSKEERLSVVNGRRFAQYDARPGAQPLPEIKQSNITRDGWGHIAGPVYKAAVTQAAAPFF